MPFKPACDEYFLQYQKGSAQCQRVAVYDIMASLQAARRLHDHSKYDYLIKLSQTINDWHLASCKHVARGEK